MLLYFKNKLDELRIDADTAFRIAHVWNFGTCPELVQDHINWVQHSIIPKYCVQWLKSLQENESCGET